jgi:hypothetical protein
MPEAFVLLIRFSVTSRLGRLGLRGRVAPQAPFNEMIERRLSKAGASMCAAPVNAELAAVDG